MLNAEFEIVAYKLGLLRAEALTLYQREPEGRA